MTCDNNLTITTQYSNTNVDHYPSVAVVNRPALRIGKVFKNLYVIVFDVQCKVFIRLDDFNPAAVQIGRVCSAL